MRKRIVTANSDHKAFYQEFTELVRKHQDHLDKLTMLAIVSNIVGKLVALQDQTKVTPEMAMTVVAENIEAGNQEAVDSLGNTEGNG